MQGKNATEKFVASSQGQKHMLPFIFMVVGGLLIILGGAYELTAINSITANSINSTIASNPALANNATAVALLHSELSSGVIADTIYAVAGVGIISGIIVMLSGVLSYDPKGNRLKTFSIVAIIFSLISIIGAAGFIIGLVFGIIGGILGLMKK